MDVRGCRTSEEIERALDKLDEQGVDYKILFLDAPDDVLMRRYSRDPPPPPHQHLPRAFPPGRPLQRNAKY